MERFLYALVVVRVFNLLDKYLRRKSREKLYFQAISIFEEHKGFRAIQDDHSYFSNNAAITIEIN